MSIWQAIILAIVEGLTEFLPVSSTGHMVIASSLMGISAFEFTKMFTISIQFGAILSVVVLYWKRFFTSLDFYKKLMTAVIPALAIGFALKDLIFSMLERVEIVAISLVLGGVVLIFIDRWFHDRENPVTTPSYKNAFVIGLFQCIAMIPGVSRSASSIIGGLTQGMTRKSAAEFSFFMAVPTMLAATVYSVIKDLLHLEISDVLTFNLPKIQHGFDSITPQEWQVLLVGNVVAFLVAMAAIKFFVGFLTKYGFKLFGYYRIVVGLVILLLLALGVDLQIV
ncbi:undecaprenyl-diphosphate phosphatase [Rufibacter glacialis]|uniref:Undecaprenyl-diphosphatase n=1 Tax=Rufibacter glacialis TaxID=1259555 RepID=A0A5M8QHF1_9BACT|nr:undecaprenyl-diphosphate phosphatase [Rufibacter glacialis]KAA6434581.1 undecaprenyl-diphosphate phosphatase [Rufibacter glacialis]GGK70773.1 undecaprenyl-diphosphatase [Rufibacter glacialis]